jgi:hypothetical protein
MRARNFLIERQTDISDIAKLKMALAGKIKTLPQTAEAFKTLREIEDLLQHVHAGGRLGLINNIISEIPDESVKEAHRELARFIASIDMTPEQRDDLFKRWKSDQLVNIKALLTPGLHTFKEIINGYTTNPAIKELTDELMRVEAYGHGKGEFILNVFSKSIGKPEGGKGDLLIAGKHIEVKTTDAGGARFGDQEVQPGEDYLQAVLNFKNTILAPMRFSSQAASGINAVTIQDLYTKSKNQKAFAKAITPVLTSLYPQANTKECLAALFSGDQGRLKQALAVASLENYMNIKKDYGVLYTDISREPYRFIFFRNNQELNDAGFRLDIGAQYLVTTNTQRIAAQFTIVPSGRLAGQQLQQLVTKPGAKKGDPIKDWASNFARNFNVTDPATVEKIAAYAKQLHDQGVAADQIVPMVQKQFKITYTKKPSKKPATAPAPAPVAPTQPALKASQKQMGQEPQI